MVYMLDKIEAKRWEIVSQQDGRHYLRLQFNDLNRSFVEAEDGRKTWFIKLDEVDLIDIGESNRWQIETKAIPAAELKKVAQLLLGRISAENRDIEGKNDRRGAEGQDLLLSIGAMMGDIPHKGEE